MLNSTNFKPARLETSSINSLNLDDVSFWKNVFSNSDYNYLYLLFPKFLLNLSEFQIIEIIFLLIHL